MYKTLKINIFCLDRYYVFFLLRNNHIMFESGTDSWLLFKSCSDPDFYSYTRWRGELKYCQRQKCLQHPPYLPISL